MDESFLPTAQTREAVSNHLQLINQDIQRATPATVDVLITIDSPLPTEIKVPAGTSFSIRGPDNQPLTYEIFRAPGDFTSDIIVPAGKKGIVAYGIEGKTGTPLIISSPGGTDQSIEIEQSNVLDEPIRVEVRTGSEVSVWRRVDILEKASADEEVYEVIHLENSSRIRFGNDIAGKSPLTGQEITVRYRTGGGIRGRIGSGAINDTRPVIPDAPYNAAVEALFRNPNPSSGGTDAETVEEAKRRAPREFSTQENAVTSEDYGILAKNFTHPVFGSVSKAIGTLRTGVDQDFDSVVKAVQAAPSVAEGVAIIQNDFVNRNIVEVYALAEGPDQTPVRPNSGLKRGLVDFFSRINVLTDEVRIYDGAIKPIDVEASVVMSRNADSGTVKVAVEDAIRDFFNINNFEMGTGMFLSNLYDVIQNVPGVSYTNIFSPADDIIETNKIADPDNPGVGFNEVITLGNLDLKFFFEKGNFKVPPVDPR